MKEIRKAFNRFCFQNRNKGIPNLMFYLSLGSAIVYIMTMLTQNLTLYSILCFDRSMILKGQIWRLFTYPLTYGVGQANPIWVVVGLLCYYSLGRAMENHWGTLRFNLFYLCGVVMMDIYSMIFGCRADVYYLNLSLFLSYATLYPNAHFLLLFIIPVSAWILALVDMIFILIGLFTNRFPYNLFPIIALLNYFLFFGKDILNVLPVSWRLNAKRLFQKNKPAQPKNPSSGPIPFNRTGSYQSDHDTPKPGYTHRCTVCGRTDVSNPELEFRYCSRCGGYRCYCSDHINNHTHIQ